MQRDLRAILADGAAFGVMVGIGETYVPAFALALGLGEVAAGLIATAPMLAGGLLQLISPWAVWRLGSHRRWVVLCAGCQAFSLILMLAMALATGVPAWLVFLPATIYWATGLAGAPAWNAWVDRLVPATMRATFFASRTRVSQLCVLLGLAAGGVILNNFGTAGATVTVFAWLFAVAAAGRLFSAVMLSQQSEPVEVRYADQNGTSYRKLLAGMRSNAGLKLVVYLLVVQAAVHIAGPYFTPFMISHLRLSYVDYMLLLSIGFLGKILALPWAGRFAQRVGAGRLLRISAAAIVPLSAGWLVSNSIPYLIVLQIFGGMAWACFELAMLLLFFETIAREQRVAMLSLYNVGNAAAIVIGALCGAAVMHYWPNGQTAYFAVFVISSIARLAALLLLPKRPPEPETVEPIELRTIAVRPMAGGVQRPVLPSTPATAADECV